MSELPEGWEQRSLGEVVDVLDSQRIPINVEERGKRGGAIPYYGATGQVGWIDKPLFNEELVLLGEDGAPFLDPTKHKAYMISGPSWVNNHAHVLRAIRGRTSNRYLVHYLNCLDYGRHVTGTTRLKLTQRALRSLPVKLPRLAEQERIVEVIEEQFSRLDAGVESLQRANRNLTRLRACPLEEIDDGGWPKATLETLTMGLRYGTSVKCIYEGSGVPVLRIPNVRNGRIDMADLKRANRTDIDLSSATVRAGDLLFIRTNGSRELIGTAALVGAEADGLAFASYLIRARPTSGILPEFLQIAMSSPHSRTAIMQRAATSAGQYNISARSLRTLEIPMPPLDDQSRIVTEVERQFSIIDAMAKTIDAGLHRADALRQSILSQAFSGRLTGAA